MIEYKKNLVELKDQIKKGISVIDMPKLEAELAGLEAEMLESGFWDDSKNASMVSSSVAALKKEIDGWKSALEECEYLVELIEETHVEKMSDDDHGDFENAYNALFEKFRELNISTFMSGKFDKNNAVLTVVCGMGGDDAEDFTSMLAKMYVKYCEKKGYKVEVLEENRTDSGLKNMSFKISGAYVFGFLKYEHGLHRLVRLSPFNSGNTRETSFAMVDVLPEIAMDDHVEIDVADLRVDTFRASGSGGQHVNTTDSAVRITHIPTGVVASSQSERSQHQNKENAMSMLQFKLIKMMHEKNAEKLEDLRGDKNDMSFGHQIRSYVLHPYKMVKDHRSSFSENNPDAVFDGKLDGFIEAMVER